MSSRASTGWLLRLLAFAAIYIVWGSTFLAIRYTTATIPPLMAAGARVLVGGALLYGYLRARGVPAPSWRSWSMAFISGGLLFVGCHGVLGWASQRVPSGISALLTASISLWMVVLGALRARKMPNRWVALGLVLGFAGLLPLIRPDASHPGRAHVDVLASVALVLGALSWAAGSLYARGRLVPEAPLQAAAMQMLTGGVLLILVSGAVGEWSALDVSRVTERSIVSLAYLIVFGSIVAFGAYVWLLEQVSAASVSTYAFVNPVVALLLGWLFGGEGLSARTLLATALIVAAVAMITMASSRPAGARTRDA
ncbi:EamA family transporter [Pendulispora brunnea]|uniref:EamA family transporter n=1 Tax=Pendulispora brunnea TaxID=2905690 RepID=A0ABZ2KJR6_9BACT